MTRDELKALLEQLGLKAEQITDQVIEKLEQKIEYEKSQLDTQTRRKVRAFWGPVGFVLGVLVTLAAQFAL